MIVLMIIYGVILACGAKMIADGSEDLLEVSPSRLFVGFVLVFSFVYSLGTICVLWFEPSAGFDRCRCFLITVRL